MEETSGTTPNDEPQPGDSSARFPDEDVTRQLPGEDATRVLSTGATQTATPPPSPPRPRLVTTRPSSGGGRWWWLFALVIVAAIAAVAIWYFVAGDDAPAPLPSPSPSSSSFAWAGAWARNDEHGGGLVIEGNGDSYTVTAYNDTLQQSAAVVATLNDAGTELGFTLASPVSLGSMGALVKGTLVAGDDSDSASLRIVRDDGMTLSLPLHRVSALTASTPSASPSPSPSASDSPPPSPSSSVEAQRQQMIAAIESIQAGIEAWAADNGNLYPMPADVREGSAVASYVDSWPVNPYEPGQPLTPGTAVGAYEYQQLEGGGAYILTGYLDNGTFVVP